MEASEPWHKAEGTAVDEASEAMNYQLIVWSTEVCQGKCGGGGMEGDLLEGTVA
jgi:hypothetical protein